MNSACVGLIGCPDYSDKKLDSAIDELFESLDLDRLILPENRVLIKPNLVLKRSPEMSATTHPSLVAAIIRHLKSRGVTDIIIAESGGGPYTVPLLRQLYATTGFSAMAKRECVELNFDVSDRAKPCPDGKRVKSFDLLTPLFDADVVINVPKLKSHSMMSMSAAVKNLFGLIAGLKKPELHCRFPHEDEFGEMLVDLCELVRPTISIVDAISCMEGDGPTAGVPRFGGMLLASENPYALDRICIDLMDMDFERVSYLTNAISRGLCPSDRENIKIVGEPIENYIMHGFLKPRSKSVDFIERLPKFLREPAAKIASPRPSIAQRSCIGCGKCAQSCPQHVITIENKKAHINYSDCIRCYCCHEMCPEKAVRIKRFLLFDL